MTIVNTSGTVMKVHLSSLHHEQVLNTEAEACSRLSDLPFPSIQQENE